jgi:hypothetical protein
MKILYYLPLLIFCVMTLIYCVCTIYSDYKEEKNRKDVPIDME